MSGFCHRIFRALYSAASEGPSPSHAASAPFPNTAVFLRGRHRAEPRNWISAPCDTRSAWPLKPAVLSWKSTVCYWELGSCVCRVNLIFQRGRREKQGLPNGSHSFPLPGKEERQAGKVAATSTSSGKSKLPLIWFRYFSPFPQTLRSCKLFSAPLFAQKPFPPREEPVHQQLQVRLSQYHCCTYSGLRPSVEH